MAFIREHYVKIWFAYTIVVVFLWFQPLPVPYLYPGLLVLYVILSVVWFQMWGLRWPLGSRGRFLCDTCKYNYGDACTRPEKPNATDCPDYKRK